MSAIVVTSGTVVEPSEPAAITAGQWYWVKDEDGGEPWLGCVMHVGSNFVQIKSPYGSFYRIHFDDFDDRFELAPDADSIIAETTEQYQSIVRSLLSDVRTIVARLGVGVHQELGSGDETKALATLGIGSDVAGYKAALVKAKDVDLPELFKQIKKANENLAVWMAAPTLPLQAQTSAMKEIIAGVEDRVFSVELYAGLTEDVHIVEDGEPAEIGEKVHLMQRRHYMDEECLAGYTAGGMEFKDIGDFDRWLAKPENLDRILPFPRSIVAFRVRRFDKERDTPDLSSFIRVYELRQLDKTTFLYLRNGGKLYRIGTAIDFGEKLFPDMQAQHVEEGRMYAEMFAGSVGRVISEREYADLVEKDARKLAQWDAHPGDFMAKGFRPREEATDYVRFDKSSVHYDAICAFISEAIRKHNRVAIIVQGLLDRSAVFHPHPPWKIWSPDGFAAAIQLVYDETRALVAGPKPDFEAYRARCNASLRTGCVTVGQDDAWELHEGTKETDRRSRNWRTPDRERQVDRWRPYGNPGPGKLARVVRYSKKSATCAYAWERTRQWSSRSLYGNRGEVLACSFSINASHVLNVDGYNPGDDPRTRADYIQWAPLLLLAEDYHAGKRPVGKPSEAE